MNAFGAVVACPSKNRRQDSLDAWNLLRGRSVEIFARTEMAVTATLQCLAQVENRGDAIAVNPILNQRFSQLIDLLSSKGTFCAEGKNILVPLKSMADQIPFRNFLCHGHASQYLDENARWIVQLQMPSVSKGKIQMSEMLLTEDSARQKVSDLHRDAARLTNQLKQLRDRISSPTPLIPSAPAAQGSR